MRSIEVNPTCVPGSAKELSAFIVAVNSFANRIQVDIDDGIFAPHLTWPYTESGIFEEFTFQRDKKIDIEVHLMVSDPKDIGVACARAGATRLIGHFEALEKGAKVSAVFNAWRESGVQEVGLGILMHTPPEALDPFINECDFVLMMSIATIGTQGIPYDERAPSRVAKLHTRHPNIPIAVDGGVSEKNIVDLVQAGATRFGVGSAITKSADPKAAYENLKTLAENALETVGR